MVFTVKSSEKCMYFICVTEINVGKIMHIKIKKFGEFEEK